MMLLTYILRLGFIVNLLERCILCLDSGGFGFGRGYEMGTSYSG